MGETLNRKQTADHFGVSLPTIDAWVRRGCPAVETGGRGREWAFDPAAVAAWCDRFRSKGSTVVAKGAPHRFRGAAPAAAVAALGHVLKHLGPIVARAALAAGASIPVAYALDTAASIRVSEVAEAYLAEHGDPVDSLMEMFLRAEDEPDWPALAAEFDQTFDEAACEKLLDAVVFPPA